MEKIISDCCKYLAIHLEINKEELPFYRSTIRTVLHQQPQSGHTGSGDHVHLIMGKILKDRILKESNEREQRNS
ncbi:MAG: hypothetical protein ACTH2P_03630 [Oceanisphaera sp.]